MANITWFCTEPTHGANAAPLDPGRFFSADSEGAPTCPTCGRQTNCMPAQDSKTPPLFIVQQQERLLRQNV